MRRDLTSPVKGNSMGGNRRDNGRLFCPMIRERPLADLRARAMRQALGSIRCGACNNVDAAQVSRNKLRKTRLNPWRDPPKSMPRVSR